MTFTELLRSDINKIADQLLPVQDGAIELAIYMGHTPNGWKCYVRDVTCNTVIKPVTDGGDWSWVTTPAGMKAVNG